MGLTNALVGKRLITSTGRRSIENPAVPLSAIDGDHDYYPMLTGGEASSAGMTVNPVTSLTHKQIVQSLLRRAGIRYNGTTRKYYDPLLYGAGQFDPGMLNTFCSPDWDNEGRPAWTLM